MYRKYFYPLRAIVIRRVLMALYLAGAALVGVGAALGAYLNSDDKQAQERRDREIETLRSHAEALMAQTRQLNEIVAQQLDAADAERGLSRRVDQLTGALTQVQTAQATLQRTLDMRNSELSEAAQSRSRIQAQLQEALDRCEERNSELARVGAALSRSEEENRNLSATLSLVHRGGEETGQKLAALRANYAQLQVEAVASRQSCEELAQALDLTDQSAAGLEKQLIQLREMYATYDKEIARLGKAVEALHRSRGESASSSAPSEGRVAWAVASSKKKIEETKAGKDADDPEFQKVLGQIEQEELDHALAASLEFEDKKEQSK